MNTNGVVALVLIAASIWIFVVANRPPGDGDTR